MPRRCSVCTHPERAQIDRLLVAGDAYRNIAGQFSLSLAAVARHRKDHLPAHLAQARKAAVVAEASTLLAAAEELRRKALALLARAERQGDLKNALGAVREARGCLDLLGRLAGELQVATSSVSIAVVTSPEWVQLRERILQALAPYPEARQALVRALEEEAPGLGRRW